MAQPYDPALKTLAEVRPADWLALTGRRRCRVTVVDSDIGTVVSGATDKVLRVHDEPEYLLHLDFEAGHFQSALPLRLRLYNSVFEYRHERTVLSAVILLRPEADSPQWNGLLQRGLPGETPVSMLRYHVVRVWQLPVEQLLAGGIGTLALAPISDVSENEVRNVIRRMKAKLSGPKPSRRANDIFAAAFVLLGLRYSEEIAGTLFDEVLGMEESTTYQAIVRKGRELGRQEGRAQEAQHMLLLQGAAKFGRPGDAIRVEIGRISDLARLEALAVRLMTAGSWQELLPLPPRRRGNGRRRVRG